MVIGLCINHVHKIQKYIDYMYHCISRLAMSGIYEFYMEHQMLIILNSLPEKWISVRLSLEYRLKSLDFNNLTDEMILDRERRCTKKDIRRTGSSAGRLDVVAKFIPLFEHNDLGGDECEEVDDVIGDHTYVPTI
jgi:hypothetical protein